MNREIKFRAWDKEYNRYLYSNDLNNLCSFFAIIEGDKKRFENIEQYIGHKDKNGKEIYEGDINKWFDRILKKDIKEVIVWNNRFGRFDGFCGNGTDEVIGNIYQNKLK